MAIWAKAQQRGIRCPADDPAQHEKFPKLRVNRARAARSPRSTITATPSMESVTPPICKADARSPNARRLNKRTSAGIAAWSKSPLLAVVNCRPE